MLKRLFVIVLSVIAFETVNAQYPNPTVRRLSKQEIAECKTPAAITYNFICAILQKDFDKMRSYMDLRGMILKTDKKIDMTQYLDKEGVEALKDYAGTTLQSEFLVVPD